MKNMKPINIIQLLIITIMLTFFVAPEPASAAFALGSKTLSKFEGRKVDVFTQLSTGLTTVQDVFEPHKVSGNFNWTLYIHNTGAAALTDLNVLVHYENDNWDDATLNFVDAIPSGTAWNNGCTITLAADTVCQIGTTAAPTLGYMKVTASAGSDTNLTIIMFAKLLSN